MNEANARKRVVRLAKTGQLAELRDAVGLSQGDVARALGLNQSTVSRWESGAYKARGAHALALIELLEAE